VKKLKEKVHRKEEVIAWLTEENIKLKKTPGDLGTGHGWSLT
jgi:hypothetical protein